MGVLLNFTCDYQNSIHVCKMKNVVLLSFMNSIIYWNFSSAFKTKMIFCWTVYKKLATFKANFVFYAVGRFSRHQFWNEHMITWTQRFALGSQKHPSLYKVSERLLFSHILAPYGATNNLLRKMSNGHAIMEYYSLLQRRRKKIKFSFQN